MDPAAPRPWWHDQRLLLRVAVACLAVAVVALVAWTAVWAGLASRGDERMSMDRSAGVAERAASSWLGRPVRAVEIMRFTRGDYVVVARAGADVATMEVLVDPYSGAAMPEPGPNMMWNEARGGRMGMMGGAGMGGMMMGSDARRWWGDVEGMDPDAVGEPGRVDGEPLDEREAAEVADEWLDDRTGSGRERLRVDDHPHSFDGYFTFDVVSRDDDIVGMLSVHRATGQVWYHIWHGTFVAERELS